MNTLPLVQTGFVGSDKVSIALCKPVFLNKTILLDESDVQRLESR
jgi:hypothetical protein